MGRLASDLVGFRVLERAEIGEVRDDQDFFHGKRVTLKTGEAKMFTTIACAMDLVGM
jgi:hypothetical protein